MFLSVAVPEAIAYQNTISTSLSVHDNQMAGEKKRGGKKSIMEEPTINYSIKIVK